MSADHFQLVKDNKVENVNMFEVYHPGFPIDFIMTSLEFSNFLFFFFCIDTLKFKFFSSNFGILLRNSNNSYLAQLEFSIDILRFFFLEKPIPLEQNTKKKNDVRLKTEMYSRCFHYDINQNMFPYFQVTKIYGVGPKSITSKMTDKFFRYLFFKYFIIF